MGRRAWTLVALVVVTTAGVVGIADTTGSAVRRTAAPAAPAAAAASTGPPNIVILMSDDQSRRLFTPQVMPAVFSRIIGPGVALDRFYASTSVCCPARSQILTGLREQDTGVDSNETRLVQPTIVDALRTRGYATMLAGKYLNSEPCDVPRPEWQRWVCQQQSDEGGLSLKDPRLNVDGVWQDFVGPTVQIEADFASDFIRGVPESQPFFVLWAPTSPHVPSNEPRDFGLKWTPVHAPSFNADPAAANQPFYMQRGPMDAAEIKRMDDRQKKMAKAVRGVDASVGSILDAIGSRIDNTLVVYLSDNGMLLGEHRRVAKMVPYEESTRVPAAVRFDRLVATPGVANAVVSNLDLSATFAELAGIPWSSAGTSILPLLRDRTASLHDAVLLSWCTGLHTCPGNKQVNGPMEPHKTVPSYSGVVTSRYKWIRYTTGEVELYDLQTDPDELHNVAEQAAYATIRAQLEARRVALTAVGTPETTIYAGPDAQSTTRAVEFRYTTQAHDSTFECRLIRNGVAPAFAACDPYRTTAGPLTAGSYRFEVRARSKSGVLDASPAGWDFQLATTGPELALDATPPRFTSQPNATFAFHALTSVTATECRVAEWNVPSPPWQPCASGFSAPALADGAWRFEVRATDGVTTTTPPMAWAFDVDTAPPTADWLSRPRDGGSKSAYFKWRYLEPVVGAPTCTLDGASKPCTGALKLTNLAVGSHTFGVRATDRAGQTKVTQITWTIT